MAPEIIDGSQFYNPSVDSWALGCIQYEIMTGQKFFNGNHQDEVIQKIKNITQQQIENYIQSQNIFDEKEKYLLKILIQKRRLQKNIIKPIQNNNQIKQNSNQNQTQNLFEVSNNQNTFQLQLLQNNRQFNHKDNEWQQKMFQQMQEAHTQQFKTSLQEYEQKEIQIITIKPEEKQRQQQSEEQKNQEEDHQIILQQIDNKLLRKNEQMKKKFQQDENSLTLFQIKHNLEIQNLLEEQKKNFEEEFIRRQEELERKIEQRFQQEFNEKGKELQSRISQQIQQEYQIQDNQEHQQKQQQQRLELEKSFLNIKNKIIQILKISKELMSQFVLSLEEKGQEKLIRDSLKILPQQYQKFQDILHNYINYFKQKIIKIEENENAIQQMNDYRQLSQLQEFDIEINQYSQQIAQEQFNAFNHITQCSNELIQQLMDQKLSLKEQPENQDNLQFNQRKQLQEKFLSYSKQIQELKSNLKNQQRKTDLLISQLGENEISIIQQIEKKLGQMYQQIQGFEQQEQKLKNQEISIQIINYNYFNFQFQTFIEQLNQLFNQIQQMYKNAEIQMQNFTAFTNEKIQLFQDSEKLFDQNYQKYHRDYEQLNQELTRSQKQETSPLVQYRIKEFQLFVRQMEEQSNEFKISLDQLIKKFNLNNIFKCQDLISDLTLKQNELLDQDKKIAQFNQQIIRIMNQEEQILKLKEENKKILQQLERQQQMCIQMFQNFSNLSRDIQQQTNNFLDSFENLKNEFKSELEKLDLQKQETEQQSSNQLDNQQRISNTFKQKFEEKKTTAQNLLQQLLLFQAAQQDEKQKLFNQFNVQCNQIKHSFNYLRFDQNFAIYCQIRKFSCQQQMEQCLEYLKQCEAKFNGNSQVFLDLQKQFKGTSSFQNQKIQVCDNLCNLQNKSVQSINEFHQFYDQFIKPYYRENFEQIEFEDDQKFQKLAKFVEISIKVKNLSFENSNQFQKTLNNQIINQDFIDKIKIDIEDLTKCQKEIEQMNLLEIQQFNQKILNKINSWFFQMLLITIIFSYQKQNLNKRKSGNAKDIGNQEECKQLLVEESKIKDLMLKCKSYLDSKQFGDIKLEELIENQRQIKESVDKDIYEIQIINRFKLNEFVKNQECIKEIIEMTQVQEFCLPQFFLKLKRIS